MITYERDLGVWKSSFWMIEIENGGSRVEGLPRAQDPFQLAFGCLGEVIMHGFARAYQSGNSGDWLERRNLQYGAGFSTGFRLQCCGIGLAALWACQL